MILSLYHFLTSFVRIRGVRLVRCFEYKVIWPKAANKIDGYQYYMRVCDEITSEGVLPVKMGLDEVDSHW